MQKEIAISEQQKATVNRGHKTVTEVLIFNIWLCTEHAEQIY